MTNPVSSAHGGLTEWFMVLVLKTSGRKPSQVRILYPPLASFNSSICYTLGRMKVTLGRINVNRILPIILAAPIILIIVFFLATQNHFLAAGSDFISYYTGASIIRQGKGNLIYDLSTQRQFFDDIIYPLKGNIANRFISPPFVALLYLPFSLLNYYFAYKLFFIANLGIFVFFLYLLAKTFSKIGTKYKFLHILPFYFFPVFVTLFMGQTSFVLAILFILIYQSLKDNKPELLGILSSALLIKPQYIFAIPFILILVKKKKKFLHWFLTATLFLFLTSILIAGSKALLNYLPYLFSTENPEFGNRAHQMVSFHAGISYLFFNSNLANIYSLGINFSLYISSLYLFAKRINKMQLKTAFVLIIFLTLVFSVHVLGHDLVLLLLPIFIILEKGRLIAPLLLFILPALSILGNTLPAIFTLLIITSLFLYKHKIFEK